MSEISILNRDIQLNINWEHLKGIPNSVIHAAIGRLCILYIWYKYPRAVINSESNGDLLACYQDSYFNHKFTIGAVYHKDSQSYSFHS